ncbi:hypothetical protein XU18_0300 [Perkinsela sp. CCAP 1560/4]|nr:hypothetical protein XU18_0300 [Perkinsela sp. CCAP 1560/4]|eukprot:KNH09615.1 hypothetical protein XU18_0300 [Perkinsela sp. CCAP 1560/4]
MDRIHRNVDSNQNPMAKQVEYQRALKAVKLERMFAKPFICALQGHLDSVSCLGLDRNALSRSMSGSFDGSICIWDLSRRKLIHTIDSAHRHAINGIVCTPDSSGILSCSNDGSVRLWDQDFLSSQPTSEVISSNAAAVSEYTGSFPFTGIDHLAAHSKFATAGNKLEIWDLTRSHPIQSYQWDSDPVISVKCNPVEPNLIAFSTRERSVAVYDIRTNSPLQKVVLQMKSGCLAWNPMNPTTLACGNDDWNIYTFDVRNFRKARNVFTSHISSVTDLHFSPTGKEFVSCSFDRTVRIWNELVGTHKSRDMYHTKRMHKCWSVRWSLDNEFIVSGSEDACVRVWKSDASDSLRPLHPNEQRQIDYHKSLKKRYGHLPEIKRIDQHRMVPKYIRTATRIKYHVLANERKRDYRVATNTGSKDTSQLPAKTNMKESRIVHTVE